MGKLLKGNSFDIRTYGSHKIGTTNVLRTLGKGPAAIVLVFDLSKGVGPVLLATLVPFLQCNLGGMAWGPTLAAIAALLGHTFPVFIGFKGGRGVLTGAGSLLIISPLAFAIAAVAALSTIAISRYVSLGSIISGLVSLACGILFFIIGQINPAFFGRVNLAQLVFMVVVPGLVIVFHYDNIGRLLAGTERKIGQQVKIDDDQPSPSPTAR